MAVEEEITDFITSRVLHKGSPIVLDENEPLVSSGRVDSLGLLHLISFIQQRFGVDLIAVGTAADYDTVAELAAAVRRHRSGV